MGMTTAIEATALRLNAKVADAAALAPAIERCALTHAPDDVIVEIKAAGINPSDVKAATGLMPYAVFPRTPGRDFAGVVIDGPPEWAGREVFGSSGDLGIRRDGTHATHLVVEAAALVEKPASISMEEAAGIGVPFVTAIEGFRRAGVPTAQDIVLVMGLNGKVGQAAAQLATWRGARVIGVVRKDEAYEGHANGPIEHGRRSVFPGGAQVAGARRSADSDRRRSPGRRVQHPGILSRPSQLCRHRHAGLVVDRKRRSAARGTTGLCQRSSQAVPYFAESDLFS
jgi:hypothetical protein